MALLAILWSVLSVSVPAGTPDKPTPFGYKISWLAVRSEDPRGLAEAIGLRKTTESGWSHGIEAAYRGEAFVSPPVRGWVLVVSSSLPVAGDGKSKDRCTSLLARLIKQFPEV
jgi:hypothetical protein